MSASSQYTLVVYIDGAVKPSWLKSGDLVFAGAVLFLSPGWVSKIDRREFKEYGDNFDVLIPRLQKEIGKLKLRPYAHSSEVGFAAIGRLRIMKNQLNVLWLSYG